MTNESGAPGQGRVGQPQYRPCPKCGTMNMMIATHCIGCGEYLPPPPGYPTNLPSIPQQKEGLSVPVILLIISIVLLVAMGALFLLLIAV